MSGCATVMAGGPDHVRVSTNPPGATVFVDNKPVGQTPVVAELDRAHGKGEVRLELPGFQQFTKMIDKHSNPWIWGNILLGGIVGVVIDMATGNASRFDDDPIAVGLTPTSGGAALPPPGPPDAKECREQRHRVIVEAYKIEDKQQRAELIRSAPTCK